MFSYISMNWRGKPLISHEVIVNLIASTTTQTGLKIEAEIDTSLYPKGLRVTDEELEKINIQKANFHGEWNYTILPSTWKLLQLYLDRHLVIEIPIISFKGTHFPKNVILYAVFLRQLWALWMNAI